MMVSVCDKLQSGQRLTSQVVSGIILSPYTSYNFSISANSSMLADALKYNKRSSYSSNIDWY